MCSQRLAAQIRGAYVCWSVREGMQCDSGRLEFQRMLQLQCAFGPVAGDMQ
jgi:hypothetical protein